MSRSSKPYGGFMNDQVFRSSSHSSRYHLDPRTPRYSPDFNIDDSCRNDYFDNSPRDSYSSLRDRKFLDDPYYGGRNRSVYDRRESIATANERVDMYNASLGCGAGRTYVQPKLCVDGRYPLGFDAPISLDQLWRIQERHLDRIIDSYFIPEHRDGFDGGYGGVRSRGFPDDFGMGHASLAKEQKIFELLRFLGAGEVAMHFRRASMGGSTVGWYPGRRGLIGNG